MQDDLISRSALIEKFKDKISRNTHNSILRIFLLEAIKIVENEPTAYSVEKVIEQIESEKEATYNRCIKGMYDAMFKDFIGIVSNGGKE